MLQVSSARLVRKLRFMHQLRVLTLLSLVVLAGLAFAPNAKADPLTFSNVRVLQNNNTTIVDLFSNPGVTLFGQQLTFLVDIAGVLPAGVTNTLQITYQAAGGPLITLDFEIPIFGTEFPPLTHLFTIPSTGATPGGTLVTFTVNIIGSSPDFAPPGGQSVDSFTYSFVVAEPVPEPVTVFTLGAGLTGLAVRLRKRRRGRAVES